MCVCSVGQADHARDLRYELTAANINDVSKTFESSFYNNLKLALQIVAADLPLKLQLCLLQINI